MTDQSWYSQQSAFTDPGEYVAVWDEVEPEFSKMKALIEPMFFHYREGGGLASNGISEERITEINLRYADSILERLQELGPIKPDVDRIPSNKVVGCCRDWALMFVSLARHHGIPARSRVGFADYFADGWWIDHTVAEVWDEAEQRWRLIDAELNDNFVPVSGDPFDPLDVPRDRFLPGLDAWRMTRAGDLTPEVFAVAPDIEIPALRGTPYLWHNVVQDLAALNRYEMVLWDVWGIDLDTVNEEGAMLLDAVASSTELADWRKQFAREQFRVPEEVLSFSPHQPEPPIRVQLRQ